MVAALGPAYPGAFLAYWVQPAASARDSEMRFWGVAKRNVVDDRILNCEKSVAEYVCY